MSVTYDPTATAWSDHASNRALVTRRSGCCLATDHPWHSVVPKFWTVLARAPSFRARGGPRRPAPGKLPRPTRAASRPDDGTTRRSSMPSSATLRHYAHATRCRRPRRRAAALMNSAPPSPWPMSIRVAAPAGARDERAGNSIAAGLSHRVRHRGCQPHGVNPMDP